nr:MAG TPA: hypothetical protein [Caudoviricetes sp.]
MFKKSFQQPARFNFFTNLLKKFLHFKICCDIMIFVGEKAN